MNFFDCTFEDGDKGAFLNQGNFKLNVSKFRTIIKDAVSSQELIMGIRPEDLSIYDKSASKNSVPITVEAFEPLGSESIVDGRVDESLIRITTPPKYQTRVGEKKFIEFNMNKLHVFDKKTEKAII
jgi:multiple sugar transport system ATP-binding protein